MKTTLIIFLLIISSSVFSQESKEQVLNIHIMNSEGEYVENAIVRVDSVLATYNPKSKTYSVTGIFEGNYLFTIDCDGYEPFSKNRSEIPQARSTNVIINLKKPDDHYYYAYHHQYPYKPRPKELLVQLNKRVEIGLEEFKNSLDSLGLDVVVRTVPIPSNGDPMLMTYESAKTFIHNRVIIEKKDGSDFDFNRCHELGVLRNMKEVRYAGPMIMKQHYFDAFTYVNQIKVKNAPFLDSVDIQSIVQELDESYIYEKENFLIKLPAEVNESVPFILEQLQKVFEKHDIEVKLDMVVWFNVYLG